MGHHHPLRLLLPTLALALLAGLGAAQTLPYSLDGISCLDQATLDARIERSLVSDSDKSAAKEGCKLACQRVEETVVSKGANCQKTAEYIVEVLSMTTGGTAYNEDRAEELLHFLIHEHGEASTESCFDDIETHWNNREKHCTPPAYYPGDADGERALEKTYDAAINDEARASAIRRFATLFMRRKHKDDDGHDHFCMGAMRNILTDPAATAFMSEARGGLCPPLLTSDWDDDSCTTGCWDQIKLAAAAAGGPKCCLAAYYADMYDFTYRPGGLDAENSLQLPKSARGLQSGCSTDRLPCTYVYDAMLKCEDKGSDDREDYNPKKCGHSGAPALAASPLLALLGAVAVLFCRAG
uniref:Uncharacterized protein n=2 Tax=Hemiselmis andersenii TaxID=464988 RepID=A0A6U2BM45_HEMAN|mmetsp:Transcript_2546/g.6029  ORF Transcript_2546/g.6029 Transcript_2546/m.6029 type:complete len:354 (+) Transcript_2546:33-1094(+)